MDIVGIQGNSLKVIDSIETVEQFTYLGIIFNYNDKFTKAEKKLSELYLS